VAGPAVGAPRRALLALLPRRPGRLATQVATVVLLGSLAVWLVGNFLQAPPSFLSVLLIGVTNGAIFGLIALGYTLVYGILELINFAHGEVFMLGGMMSATLALGAFSLVHGEPAHVLYPALVATLLISMAFCAALNALIELVAYRRLRNAPRLAPLITAVGMSFILQNVGLLWKGPGYVSLPRLLPNGEIFSLGGVPYTWDKLIVLLVTAPVLLGLILLVQRTRAGKAMRATAQDPEAARLMGIDVNRTISFTFALAGALAGAAGFLYALYVTTLRFDQGFQQGLLAFTAAVLGGIGNLGGAVLGALLIGLIQAFNEGLAWLSPGSDWTQSIVFTVLILILVLRPEGLLGERTPEGG
jgi:branched-chain amino acid transport system permease protein